MLFGSVSSDIACLSFIPVSFTADSGSPKILECVVDIIGRLQRYWVIKRMLLYQICAQVCIVHGIAAYLSFQSLKLSGKARASL